MKKVEGSIYIYYWRVYTVVEARGSEIYFWEIVNRVELVIKKEDSQNYLIFGNARFFLNIEKPCINLYLCE